MLARILAPALVCCALVAVVAGPGHAASGVSLSAPTTVHSNGAELSWSIADPATFDRYEIHRSDTASFTPSASTLLATISDRYTTSFRDTTAAASKTFTYKVVVAGVASAPQTVSLPADGQARTDLQPAPAAGEATYVRTQTGSTGCDNHGGEATIVAGTEASERFRGLLQFDLGEIPAGSSISGATLSVYRAAAPSAATTISVQRLTKSWAEGSGSGSCMSAGANWNETDAGVPWQSPGGDFSGTQEATAALTSASGAGWDNFDLKSLVSQWNSGSVPNFGVVAKATDESGGVGHSVAYRSDDEAVDPTRRPKLSVTYTDGSHAQGPTVDVSDPESGDVVRGTQVVTAAAADDRRVEKVTFLVDGAAIGTDTSAPFSVNWNTSVASNAKHTISATAYDDAGNSTTSSGLSVTVANSALPSTSISTPVPSYDDLIKADSPLGYWRLGETSGTTANDASGNANNGTYAGGFVLGQAGLLTSNGDKATKFQNATSDGRVTVSTLGGKLATTFSAEAWINDTGVTTKATTSRILARGWGAAGGWLLAAVQNSAREQRIEFSINKGGTIYTASALATTPGVYHVVGTYDGTTARLYLNGAQAASASVSAAALNTTSSVLIGETLNDDLVVDEAAAYSSALTSDQVKRHYDDGKGRSPTVKGTTTISAAASDDVSVDHVEFYVDGTRFDSDSTAPYSGSLKTLDSAQPVYDGDHTLTTVAYDESGQTKESAPVTVTVANGEATKYIAALSSTAFPQAVSYDSSAATQDKYGIDATVTNKSAVTWSATDVVARYRWISPDPSADQVITDGPEVPLGADLPAGQSRTVRLQVEPPALPAGVERAEYQLRVDLYSKSSPAWFADKGSPPLENPVIVNKALATGLGLERWWEYEGEELGGGMQHLVNVANGNSIVRLTPFEAPGRGLSTVLDLTYNSLEKKSDSPVGNNWSLSVSGLTRFGLPLDVHPNKADEIAGRANRFIELTDGDGTTHRFVGKQAADGSVYWEEPDGVHLYLRNYSDTDPAKKWALTRPDRVTFFYDADGYPTSIEDANGNRLTFTLETVPPGEDPGGPKKRITEVTDPAGNDATPAANRKFTMTYYSKADAQKPQIRGKIKTISDHSGSKLEFAYYEDGNLLSISQKGGKKADGTRLSTRGWFFTYTTSDGSGPAIPLAADRTYPDPKTPNQSTRLYSIRDPRKYETTFAYFGPTAGADRWKLSSRTNREAQKTSYVYDTTNRITTVKAPLARNTKYEYDVQGQVTAITNPKNERTQVKWNGDRAVERVTEPNGIAYTEYHYNANGYLKDVRDQRGATTILDYEDLPADSADTSAHWKTGRTVGHVSQLRKKTDPNGAATPTDDNDHRWLFDYDSKGNLRQVTDPEDKATTYVPNADGTVASITDPNTHTTTFEAYDPSGLPTKIKDAKGQRTQFGYDSDGNLLWIQDPRHPDPQTGDPREYRSYFDYDAFGRLERQSAPKLTGSGQVVWSSVSFDYNDNVRYSYAPHYSGVLDGGGGAQRETQYDKMDRPVRSYEPDVSYSKVNYDAAGRVISTVNPKGMQPHGAGAASKYGLTEYGYDANDRVIKKTDYDTDQAGNPQRTLRTLYCYDSNGDLTSVTKPEANLDIGGTGGIDCATQTLPRTTYYTYNAAHMLEMERDPLGHTRTQLYDQNGNVTQVTNEDHQTECRYYDGRDRVTRVTQPFAAARQLTTQLKYDAVGNLIEQAPPRAWDAAGGARSYDCTTENPSTPASFGQYATSYRYDELDRLTHVDLPTSSKHPEAHHIHREYDPNGNLASVSLPVVDADSAPADKKTTFGYFDTGWIQSSNDPANPKVVFDYTAEGQQTSRTPVDANGTPIPGADSTRTYNIDGTLKDVTYKDGVIAYQYDANDNLTHSDDSLGAEDGAMTMTVSYDSLDQPVKTREQKGTETDWRITTFSYDLDGNVAERGDNGREDGAGASLDPVRKQEFTYDEADWLRQQIDRGPTSSTGDDRRITSDYFDTGWQKERTVAKYSDATSQFDPKQTTSWSYYLNGKLKTLDTTNGSGTNLESHNVSYEDGQLYVNGERTQDVFSRRGPDTNAPCRDASSPCTTTYEYDPSERLVKEVRDRGSRGTKTTNYELYADGNIHFEDRDGVRTTYEYDGQQLTKLTKPGQVQKYFYDARGNLDCVTNDLGSKSDCSPPTGAPHDHLWADYTYDGLDRMKAFRAWKEDGSDDRDSSYQYDGLDRLMLETTKIGTKPQRTSAFSYVGLTNDVAQEQRYDGPEATGQVKRTKTYSYDAYGHRITMTDQRSSETDPRTYNYGYDVHGSVSLLVSDAGQAKASYGYTAYGEKDPDLTRELTDQANDPNTPEDESIASDDDPVNPFRYSGKRLDEGSGTLDMGARRFGPDIGRFLERDAYEDALGDLDLAADPLASNRYGLAGGNPVGFVEHNGHMYMRDGGGSATAANADHRAAVKRGIRAVRAERHASWVGSRVAGAGDAASEGPEGRGASYQAAVRAVVPGCTNSAAESQYSGGQLTECGGGGDAVLDVLKGATIGCSDGDGALCGITEKASYAFVGKTAVKSAVKWGLKKLLKREARKAEEGLASRGLRAAPGTRVRPPGIPEAWRVRPTQSPGGARYYDPANPGNSVRVMQGNPSSPFANSRHAYVRWQKNGQPLDAKGNVLPSANSPDAHIPLNDFRFRPELFD